MSALSYGVFSRLAADDGEDSEETLYRVEDTVGSAVRWLGRYSLYRAYGEVPSSVLCQLMQALDKMASSDDISKEVKVGGLVYYIRELDEKALAAIAKTE